MQNEQQPPGHAEWTATTWPRRANSNHPDWGPSCKHSHSLGSTASPPPPPHACACLRAHTPPHSPAQRPVQPFPLLPALSPQTVAQHPVHPPVLTWVTDASVMAKSRSSGNSKRSDACVPRRAPPSKSEQKM
eukprot:353621-Chlamydomonas_euryale.AAC.4